MSFTILFGCTGKEENYNHHSSSTDWPSCNITASSTNLWHNRLSHVSLSRLSFIVNNLMNFPFNLIILAIFVNWLSKVIYHSIKVLFHQKKPFDMIHYDIWGCYWHLSLYGAYYFLTIVDDYTHFTWIFLMHHTTEAQCLLRCFFAYVNAQFESRIKTLRSNNGGEFISLQSSFQDHDVIFQTSCIYMP